MDQSEFQRAEHRRRIAVSALLSTTEAKFQHPNWRLWARSGNTSAPRLESPIGGHRNQPSLPLQHFNLPKFRYNLFELVSLYSHSLILSKWDIPTRLLNHSSPASRSVSPQLKMKYTAIWNFQSTQESIFASLDDVKVSAFEDFIANWITTLILRN